MYPGMTESPLFESSVASDGEKGSSEQKEVPALPPSCTYCSDETTATHDDIEQNAQTSHQLHTTSHAVRRFLGLVDASADAAAEGTNFCCLTDEEQALLDAILQETGKSSHGIRVIEVYAFANPQLVPVGFWIRSDIVENASLSESDKELLSCPGIAHPNSDLVGVLWSTEKNISNIPRHGNIRRPSSLANRGQASSSSAQHTPWGAKRHDPTQLPPRPPPIRRHPTVGLHWQKLKSIIEDPDLSHGPRTEALYKAGLVQAAGIEFTASGIRGMVVYYAVAGDASRFTDTFEHETYLRRMTAVKGTILAAISARRLSLGLLLPAADETESHGMSIIEESSGDNGLYFSGCGRIYRDGLVAWIKKAKGGGAQIPSCFSWIETAWTFVGSFVGLCILSLMNKTLKILTNEQYALVIGPFGALMMLQYGLTGAPAGQPRTIIFGHAIAGIISVALTYVPTRVLPEWWRMILSAALATSAMVKLGVACPPASAHSLIYAEGEPDWKFFGVTMVCIMVSLIPAIAINNLNPRRQYPAFWGYSLGHLKKRHKEKRSRHRS